LVSYQMWGVTFDTEFGLDNKDPQPAIS